MMFAEMNDHQAALPWELQQNTALPPWAKWLYNHWPVNGPTELGQ